MKFSDAKLMHDRLMTVECREPYDTTIIEEAGDALLCFANSFTDAIRYRWLRDRLYVDDGILCILPDIYCHKTPNRADIDAAIDADMASADVTG